MTADHPLGYQEIGATLAQAVAEGVKSTNWATEIAKMLGYTANDVKAWVEHYSFIHAKELDMLERTRQRKIRKISRWQRRSRELRSQKPKP